MGSQPVMVKKSKRGWRICVDFTDINKACPKDCYTLPEIYWKIESLSGFCLKCFLDAYKGYHQIQMAEEDEDKIAFYAREGVFYYKKMPFGLKNTRVTYQRLVDKVFIHQIGRNIEAYVDDMVIKSTSEKEMLKDIQETFERTRKTGRVAKWAIKLGEHDIVLLRRNEKETPADLLVEMPFEDSEKKEKQKEVPDSNSKEYTYTLRLDFETTNNEAEYEALLADPQEEEDDMEVDIEEDENEPELTYPNEKVDPLNPPLPASESEPDDEIKVENLIEHEDDTIPVSVYKVGGPSTTAIPREDETAHALVKKKGKAKDKFYGKLILDLGNDVHTGVEQGTAAMEKLVEKLGNTEDRVECKKLKKELQEARFSNIFLRMQNERVEIDLYWTRVRAREFYQEMIRRGFGFEKRPSEAINVPIEDEKSPLFEPQGSPHDS
ncbi:putative reverse transcriptase domain-containing protein [Tanacetum coccineum]